MEPIQAMLRMMQQVIEREWVQKTLYDIWLVGRPEVSMCHKEALYHCPSWREARNEIREGLEGNGNTGQTRRRRTGHGKEA